MLGVCVEAYRPVEAWDTQYAAVGCDRLGWRMPALEVTCSYSDASADWVACQGMD